MSSRLANRKSGRASSATVADCWIVTGAPDGPLRLAMAAVRVTAGGSDRVCSDVSILGLCRRVSGCSQAMRSAVASLRTRDGRSLARALGPGVLIELTSVLRLLDSVVNDQLSEVMALRESHLAALLRVHPSRAGRRLESSGRGRFRELRGSMFVLLAFHQLSRFDSSIKAIALGCGFACYSSAASFCRAFKRETGLTPNEFRQLVYAVRRS